MTELTRKPVKCVGCEEEFTPNHGKQIWCTDKCRAKYGMRYTRMLQKKGIR